MDESRFEELVWEAVEQLPSFFKDKLENVAIIVQEYPSPEMQGRFPGRLLLGIYHGVPRSARSVFAQYPSPDVIYIYRRNIESICRTDREIKQQVRKTVIHEIGHHFGLTDERIRKLEREGA